MKVQNKNTSFTFVLLNPLAVLYPLYFMCTANNNKEKSLQDWKWFFFFFMLNILWPLLFTINSWIQFYYFLCMDGLTLLTVYLHAHGLLTFVQFTNPWELTAASNIYIYN